MSHLAANRVEHPTTQRTDWRVKEKNRQTKAVQSLVKFNVGELAAGGVKFALGLRKGSNENPSELFGP